MIIPVVKMLVFPPFRLDTDEERLWRDSSPVDLRPRTYAVLKYLLERPGRLVRNNEVLEAIWEGPVTPGTLNTSIRELRKALGDDARQPRYIETVHRRGFRFIAEVRSGAVGALETDERVQAAPVPVVSAPSRLHGRGSVLDQLGARLAAAHEGARQIVFVTGEIGIGKTSLLRAFVEQRAAAGPETFIHIAWGQSVSHRGQSEAFHPVLDAFGRINRIEDPAALRGILRSCAPTWLIQLPWLTEPGEAAELRQEVGGATEARMLREFCVAVEVLTRDRTLVLVLEDLHWSDVETVDLIGALAERTEPARLLLLGSYRPVDAAMSEHPIAPLRRRLRQRQLAVDMPLDSLPEQAVESYLCDRFDWQEGPRGLAAVIDDQTDGNPLLMVTLTSYLISTGVVARSEGAWHLTVPVEDLPDRAPESLREIVEGQLQALAPEDRDLLKVAAVAGESFDTQALAAGLEAEQEAVEEMCDRLARWGQFIEDQGEARWPDRSVGRRFGFQHAAFRQVIYSRISPARRQKLHLRIAERTEAGYASDPEAPLLTIADHFEEAGDLLRTVTLLGRAAASERRRFAHREAANLLRRALELLEMMPANRDRDQRELELRGELSVGMAVGTGWGDPALGENLDRCLELSRRLGDARAEAFTLDRIVRRHIFRSDYSAAGASLEELRPIVPSVESPALQIDAAYQTGFLALRAGDLGLAAESFAAALDVDVEPVEMFEAIMYNPRSLAMCAGAYCSWLRGLPDDAWAQAQAGVMESERAREVVTAVAAHAIWAELGRFTGNADEVRVGLDRYRAATEAGGIFFRSPTHCASESWLMLENGEVDAAIDNLRRGKAAVQSAGTTHWASSLYVVIAEALLEKGDAEGGLREVEEALDYCAQTGERAWEAELHRLRGELQLRQGELDSAHTSFGRALEISRAQGARSLELRAATSLARSWHQQGQPAKARGVLEPILSNFDKGHDTRDVLTAAALLQTL